MKSEGLDCRKTVKFSIDDQEDASEPPDLVNMVKNLASHVPGSSNSSVYSPRSSCCSSGNCSHNLSMVSNCSCPNYNPKKRRCGRFEVTDLEDDDEMMYSASTCQHLREEALPTEGVGCSVQADEHSSFNHQETGTTRAYASHNLSGSFHSGKGEPQTHRGHSSQQVSYRQQQQTQPHYKQPNQGGYQYNHPNPYQPYPDSSVKHPFNTPSDISSVGNQSFSSDMDPGYCTPYFEQERRQYKYPMTHQGQAYFKKENHGSQVPYYSSTLVTADCSSTNYCSCHNYSSGNSTEVAATGNGNNGISEMYKTHHDIVIALSEKLNTLPEVSNMINNILDRVIPHANVKTGTLA
mmetsp:Transcript_39942/g.45594  ORF Transcript_39942/g.45594 Transcript_39942/m.45594 type:complete len:350 (+) Transcript_39942:141-1190(+)